MAIVASYRSLDVFAAITSANMYTVKFAYNDAAYSGNKVVTGL